MTPPDSDGLAPVATPDAGTKRSRRLIEVGSLIVVVALAALLAIVLAGRDRDPNRRPRAEDPAVRYDTTTTTVATNVPAAAAPLPGSVTTVALGQTDSPPVIGAGSAWVENGNGIQRIAPGTGEVHATISVPGRPIAFEGGRLWLFGTDTDRRCTDSPLADFPSYSP